MVAAENEEVLWVLDLVCQKKADRLKGLLASIDIISKEEVVGFRWESAVFEEAEQVVVLSVYVAANLDG